VLAAAAKTRASLLQLQKITHLTGAAAAVAVLLLLSLCPSGCE
jgi:hypothetical protein